MVAYRHNRNDKEEMRHIIERVWMNPGKIVYRDAVGVAVKSPESIYNSFLFVQDMYGNNLNVKIHVLELKFIKEEFSPKGVAMLSQLAMKYFGQWYQCFGVVEERESDYSARFCINACSYNGAGKFVDNNMAYIGLRDMIISMIDKKVTFLYDSTVLFSNQNNNIGNYVAIDDFK